MNYMRTLDKFVAFAKALPAKEKADIEAVLTSMMLTYADETLLSPAQEEENRKRFADPNPQYATQEQVTEIFGKPFPA